MFLVFVTITILVEDPVAPGFGYNEFQMGLVAVPSSLGMLAFAPLWGRWVAAKGPKPVMLAGFSVMGLGALGLAIFHSSIVELMVFVVPTMVGNVAVLIAMSNIIVLTVSPKELGIQTGMNQTFRNLGSAVGPVLGAVVIASYARTIMTPNGTLHPPTITGFVVLFALVAAVALVGLVLSLGLRNYRFHADGTRSDAARPRGAPAAPTMDPASAPVAVDPSS
ncbi:MAG TPA: MFS transporter [Thermoplasmata archaeon]|nr:MFS transporter [Thermoplasmata archaeon]